MAICLPIAQQLFPKLDLFFVHLSRVSRAYHDVTRIPFTAV